MNPNPQAMKWLGGLAAAGACALAVAASEKIYYQEDFRNYSDAAPGVICIPQAEQEAKGRVEVGNDPIWSISAELNIRPKVRFDVFPKGIELPGLAKFDFYFRFRFMNAAAEKMEKDKNGKEILKPAVAGEFTVMLNDKPLVFRSFVEKDAAKNKMTVSFGGKTFDAAPVANWKWEEVALKADGGKLSIYISRDRAFQLIGSVPFSAALKKANFTTTAGREFAFSSVMIKDFAPLKTYPVEKHFADFRSRNQPMPKGAVTTDVSAVPDQAGFAGFVVKVGKAASKPLVMKLHWSNGTVEAYPVSCTNYTPNAVIPVLGKSKGTKLELGDAVIQFGDRHALARQFVRPDLRLFQSSYDAEPQYIDIVREWDRLPAASEHPLNVDFVVRKDNSVDFYLDGSLVKNLRVPLAKPDPKAKKNTGKQVVSNAPLAKLAKIEFTGNSVSQVYVKKNEYKGLDRAKFYPVDLTANPRAKAFYDAKLSVKPGFQTVEGIPMAVVSGKDSADVAICKQGKGNWALEVEEYHGRHPEQGFPSAIHFRLPAAPYGKAYILCALDPDPKKDKILTTRMGYYVTNGCGGNMLGDNVIEIKDGKIPSNFKQVGTVELKGKTMPLYFVEIPLALGNILDIPARKDYIEFEFTGKGWENFEQLDNTMKPDPNSDSAFNIFAVTLEKAPVLMDIEQAAPGNVFTEDEKDPRTTVTLKADRDNAKCVVKWSALDIDGKEIFKGAKNISLAKEGDKTAVEIPLKAAVGFYDLIIRLEVNGATVFTHPARFAILQSDRRKAEKTTSPYATWWFNAHGSPGDMDLGGPLMQKAGIRKASWNTLTPEGMEKYNITNCGNLMCPGMREFSYDPATGKGQFKSGTRRIENPDKKKGPRLINVQMSGEEFFVHSIKSQMKPGLHYDHVLIWHESAPGYGIPEELLNMPVPQEKDQAKIDNEKRIAAYVNEAGRLIRKHFPNLKIQLGNSSASIGAATRPLRAGADPQYFDYIGIETPSQVICPEKLQEVGFQGLRISSDIANKLAKGKKNVKINGSWEFTYRCERDMGEQQQAEWYMRDVLISLANDFFLISPGIFFDCASGYYNGLWGGSGILLRGPYVYPKRAYVAYAALTNVLDRVKFSRQIPTGSTSVYAIEFKRADGKFVTALWASRGSVKFAVENPNGAAVVTEMYGKEYPANGKNFTVDGGTAPLYVTTAKPLASVAIVGRSFPKDEARAAKAKVAAAFDDAAKVTVEPDPQFTSTHTGFLPILKPAAYTATTVQDAEKGASVQVTLSGDDKYKSRYIVEYTTIRLKEPATVPGNPAAVGLWVKGNSNGAQIRFEIEDAHGEIFKNISTGRSWGCDIMDWPGNLAVNFDGWCFIAHPLRDTKLFNDHSPGPVSEQWISCGGDKKIDLPIKIRAVTVGMYRQKLDLLDFKPSAPSILIRDFSGIEE